jgi:Fe-S cluster assembly protein SufD
MMAPTTMSLHEKIIARYRARVATLIARGDVLAEVRNTAWKALLRQQKKVSKPSPYGGTPFVSYLGDALKISPPSLPPPAQVTIKTEAPLASYPLHQLPEQLQPYRKAHFAACAQLADPFVDWHTASFGQGTLLYIPPYTICASPVEITHHVAEHALGQPRLVIVAGVGSRSTIVFRHTAPTTQPMHQVSSIHLGEAAELTCYHLTPPASPERLMHTCIMQAPRSRLRHYDLAFAPHLLQHHLEICLQGESSQASCHGLYIADKQGKVAHHLAMRHQAASTQSTQGYRGITAGRSSGFFSGHAHILPGSSTAQAAQRHDGLLLSDGARIHAEPLLSVADNQVQCSHAATITQLDAEQLFSLQARGVPQKVARELLIMAFATALLTNIPDAEIASQCSEWCRATLPKLGEEKRI